MSIRNEALNIWQNVQELDLRPIRDAAERPVQIALVGAPEAGKRTLASQLRTDSHFSIRNTHSPIQICTWDEAEQANDADLIVVVIDVQTSTVEHAQAWLRQWQITKKTLLVFYNKVDLLGNDDVIVWLDTQTTPKLYGSALDRAFLETKFAEAVLTALPEHHLALGRQFPLFRDLGATKLINETSLSNAAYSLGTGLAEIVPLLDVPLNVADIIILTKTQALLVYKLGLLLGMSTDWQYYVAEFGSVVGSGFLWRQMARSLVGLIPIWGIVPKVGVAYSGTFVVGHVVVQWYKTGRHLSQEKIRDLTGAAFDQGKEIARGWVKKMPRPKRLSLRKRKQDEEPTILLKPDDAATQTRPVCAHCATLNEHDAKFCKSCGQPFDEPLDG
jgi:uncharacterized protein (DUF697 family)